MKKVFFCETPFQVIVSLFIKEQFTKKRDIVDIVIFDTFSGYEKVALRLKDKKIYNNVYVVKIKDIILSKTIWQHIRKVFFVLFPKIMIRKRWYENIKNYDEMYLGNYDLFTSSVRSYYAFRGHHPKVFMYEEAYASYFPIDEMYPMFGLMKFLDFRNKLLGKGNIVRSNIDGWFLFEPDNLLYKPNCNVYQIDRRLNKNKKIKEVIDYIFDVRKVLKNYDRKYIIFEEASLANNSEIDDEKIFDKIIEIVGRDNVIVKLHPRTVEDRFTKKGIKTLGSDGVPWEALACVGNFNEKVLISIASSSIVTYRMLFGNKMKAYMLFRFIDTKFKQFESKYDEFWNKVGTVTSEGGICIPKSEKEFFRKLKEESDCNEKKNNNR